MAYIKGIFMQDIFNNPDNGYIVGLIRVRESDNDDVINKVVTFTGIFDDLKYKMQYKMEGNFVNHSKYGMQFKVDNYEIVLPSLEEETIEFLSSSMFPIGEATAKKIVKKLGNDAIKKIMEDANCLLGIPRLTDTKIEKIMAVLTELDANSGVVLELNKLGFNTKDAIAIFKEYGNRSLDIINDNIYRLIDTVGISFLEIDKIARNMGMMLDDERRVLALTVSIIQDVSFNNGDTYLYFDEIYECIVKNTNDISRDTFLYILMKLAKLDKIVIDKERYYLKELYDAEVDIVNKIYILNEKPKRKLPKLEDKIRALELVMGINYDESQKEAIIKAINNNITIITGGPGTGKTTIIRCIVKLLLEIMQVKPEKLALLAPTGRAARKLMETTGIPAYTIHKYLKWDKESNSFEVGKYNPNMEEYIIVDEVSMVDTILLASLFRGTLDKTKFILVGDYYQLPSVREGQVLKDLIDSNYLDVIKLQLLYRQSEDSYIPTLAYEIKNREMNENFLKMYDDYNFITCKNEEIIDVIKSIVIKAIDKGYDKKDIQVLAPIYKTINGVDALNKILQEIINPKSNKKNELVSGSIIYREGDKILQLVNDSDNGISNGDIGYIESIVTKNKKSEMIINFDGTRVTYTPKDFINIMHGYAISVHKSQGGEFKMVIIPFSPSFKRMLYNKLIYTAVTRAKQSLILVGDVSSFIYGINNNSVENRKTTIKEMLENKYK